METIFALATPPGKSGVAVIRVSGPEAKAALSALGVSLPLPRRAVLAALKSDGLVMDKALVLYFNAPHSFTGEDTAEFHIHGSRAVITRLLAALGTLPHLRPAEPGEFTRRAFMNGKMDLTAAEGLADLIDAETEAQRRQALRFMQGEAASFYGQMRAGILEALALTEAYIDFPDEEIPSQVLEETRAQVQSVAALISAQLSDGGAAERVRDGVQVAIIGPPNAGKSSLMNLLARRDVAIVSEIAGTTRDVIEVHLDIGGYAVVLADTAGLREAEDAVEREGVRRSLSRAREADIRLVVMEAGESVNSTEYEYLIGKNAILLLNKCDRIMPNPLPALNGVTAIPFSAHTGMGMESLLAALHHQLESLSTAEASFITRSRHRHHLAQAMAHLKRYLRSPESHLELACEELRRAAVEIGKITGVVSPEEVLGHIFSRFCIGK